MAFQIPNVPLIPQRNKKTCWYAAAQMLIAWRRGRTLMTETDHPDPLETESPEWEDLLSRGESLWPAQSVELAKQLGLTPVPPSTPSPQAIEMWLRTYGPIWFSGTIGNGQVSAGHVVVITGISDNALLINDPSPGLPGGRGSTKLLSLDSQGFGRQLTPLHWLDGVRDAVVHLVFGSEGLGIIQDTWASNFLYFRD